MIPELISGDCTTCGGNHAMAKQKLRLGCFLRRHANIDGQSDYPDQGNNATLITHPGRITSADHRLLRKLFLHLLLKFY
jgi:hypothetical protein